MPPPKGAAAAVCGVGITDLASEEISAIPDLSRSDLTELWIEAYGQAPSTGLSRRLLENAAAYRLQARTAGGLKPAARRKLRKWSTASPNNAPPSSEPAGLPPGSRLFREWHGRIYTVDVLETGFSYDGNQYGSLSQIARAITGARWSGPRFFNL